MCLLISWASPLPQLEWCADAFSCWILLICERFSLNALIRWCQAEPYSLQTMFLPMLHVFPWKQGPSSDIMWCFCFIQITLKFLFTSLLQFIIPWIIMNPLVLTSTWLSGMQMPYLLRAAGHRGCPLLNTARYVQRLLVSFCASLPQKEPALQEINNASIFVQGFLLVCLAVPTQIPTQKGYWSRKINFDWLLPEIPCYSTFVGYHAVCTICLDCDDQHQCVRSNSWFCMKKKSYSHSW